MSDFSNYLYNWSPLKKYGSAPDDISKIILKAFLARHPGCLYIETKNVEGIPIVYVKYSSDSLQFRQNWKNAWTNHGYDVPLLDIETD